MHASKRQEGRKVCHEEATIVVAVAVGELGIDRQAGSFTLAQ
jgi:hypothetical protein